MLTMTRKVIHEHKIPKSVTVALYAIAIALTLNLAKPFVDVRPAIAGYHQSDVENALSNMNSTLVLTNSILFRLEDKIDDIEDDTASVRFSNMEIVSEVSRIKNMVDDLGSVGIRSA